MKSVFFSAFLKLLAVAGFAAMVINDGGAIITGYYRVPLEAEQVAEEAARDYRLSKSPSQALAQAKSRAQADGVHLTEFQIARDFLRVSVEIPPKNTWVAHRISSLQPYLAAKARYDHPLN